MKTPFFYALVGIFSVLTVQPATATPSDQTLDDSQNYVVIGAFRYQRNALRFSQHATHDLSLDAHIQMNPIRKLYYVYVLRTPDRAQAISEALRLRAESELTDTWVYSGAFGAQESSIASHPEKVSPGVDIHPETERKMEQVPQEKVTATEQTEPVTSTAGPPQPKQTPAEKPAAVVDDGLEGKRFVFRLYRSSDNAIVEGDVNTIDIDRSRKMGTYKGNMVVKVSDPASKSDSMAVVCEVFGYRKMQRNLYYNKPEGEDIQLNADGTVEVPFELMRLRKGDIAVMYNVYFFKDAAIMRPESRFEITSLLNMLKENPAYKIRIHGHTNGGATGKLITMDEGSDQFFALSGTKEGIGTAKKLSEERALIIQRYLVSNGIEPGRMEVKAWGGKRPLHDKLGARAHENVRVEIEILEE